MGLIRWSAAIVLLAGVICQDEKSEDFEKKLCADKSSGELFRLQGGKEHCRDVVQCTSAGFQAVRCPPGLAFDLEKQTCDWKNVVDNCDQLTKERKVKPLLVTDEPLCEAGHLACGDGTCKKKELFCDGVEDCTDGSDENACDGDTDPNRAPPCNTKICQLPDCFCSEDGTVVPGGLCPDPNSEEGCTRVPQMVMVTFDDAINNNNIDLYAEIFNKQRRNPNGCDIKATFFVSHKYTNYSAVSEMHRLGHEIASHSITHNEDESFWSDGSVKDWAKEMAGNRLITEKFAQIKDNSIVGLRAPFLRVGGNNQFKMMEEQSFLYDSSITVPLQNPPLWPYTMYFKMPHRCHGNLQNCPTRSHAVWEIAMNELDPREDPSIDEGIAGCAMVDSCTMRDGDQFYNFLNHNFYRHFDQNRAPLGLYFHAAWLKNNPEFLDAFLFWVDEVLENHPETYFVTQTQVIQWIQEPVKVDEAKNYAPWQEKCSPGPRTECLVPNSCKLATDELPGEAIRMYTCERCPNKYPWLNDPLGEGIL